jgi:DNA-binding transcriptional MerR regulator
MKQYSIQGREVWLLTIQEMSKVVGVRGKVLREWEKRGILPKPLVTDKIYRKLTGECRQRLYTQGQSEILAQWVSKVRPGKGVVIKDSLIQMLHEKWEEASKKFLEDFNKGD